MPDFKKVLIANRGEIACRVIATCKKLGIKTVAVYSDADRNSLHVRNADEAYLLGPGPSAQSYLLQDKIIELAQSTGSDAIHPGYGFLSENAGFANKLKEVGIKLIGPSAASMELMGSKLASKAAVLKYDVPLVPGTEEPVTDPKVAIEIAANIGYPVLIKASAGGGGKGMRIVRNAEEMAEQMDRAMNEARSSFGDEAVFLEKFVEKPRHIEIQILGDEHGNYLHLFERECSIQRRHQKLVEEAPSAVLTPELREKMGSAAVRVAQSCDYHGAGTVEFLLDANHNFYFLEMNTRLQVEHPVTELITGLDLVEQQIRVAEGKPLQFKQEDLSIQGHAIELRLCTEDPLDNFLPSLGKLEKYRKPEQEWVRVDDFVEEGYEIPIHYDNMFAKLIVSAASREEAIERMREAIASFEIEGVPTTLDFGDFVMQHPAFKAGDFDTSFIEKYFNPDTMRVKSEGNAKAAAVLSAWLQEHDTHITLPEHKRDNLWSKRK